MSRVLRRESLVDLFDDFAERDDVFLVHDDGYRTRQVTYRALAHSARAFARHLDRHGVGPDDKVVIWSENRIEWVAAMWGCLLARVVLVPVDYRASADLLGRISDRVQAKAILVGAEVQAPTHLKFPVWPLAGNAGAERFTNDGPPVARPARSRPEPSTTAEIIFTSGATSDPKGVMITHRNVLANVVPIEREVRKYRRYERPFHPIRFLNLLPLSHMFGQSMATFVPPLLGGTVVFSHGYSPHEILRQIKVRRVSVLVCVPKVLDVLREHVRRLDPAVDHDDPAAGRHWLWRWWYFRKVRRLFGWKFWCIVVGAAPLEPQLEAFWRKLGLLVVQGYGLTETAPVVTLNHPFRASRGTVGTPIAGVEVRIAPDGEILVRGDNVTSGYFNAPDATDEAFADGWFHTGDIGELDGSGRLVIKGRKKEMIVTAQGLNVFPEDVERALLAQPGVRDAGVIGLPHDGEERVHAVLVLEPEADAGVVVRNANAGLEDHQRIWGASVWSAGALPRTEGTQKLKRRDLQRWASGESRASPATAPGRSVEQIVSRMAGGRPVTEHTTMDELGLSSLDRVELMMALEEAFQTTLDETMVAEASTVGDLRAMAEGQSVPRQKVPTDRSAGGSMAAQPDRSRIGEPSAPIAFPSWNRSGPSWLLRRLSLPTWILPLGRVFVRLRVEGLEHLARLEGPVVFAANHQSHFDTPVILMALPARWRYRLAPAMAKEFFTAHFNPAAHGRKAWFTNSLNYYLAAQFFGAFPLPQREAGTRQTLRYIGAMAEDGYSLLIFPEGKRTRQGEIAHFRPGVGMIASRVGLPIVPVRLEGLEKVLHPKMKFPKRGPARVAFGPAIRTGGDDYASIASEVEAAVRRL